MSIAQKYGTQCKEQPVKMGGMPFFKNQQHPTLPPVVQVFIDKLRE